MAIEETSNVANLTGIQKAAVLLISLGSQISADILRYLDEDEIEALSVEIASITTVDSDTRDLVFAEFVRAFQAKEYVAQGGLGYVRSLLEQGLDPDKAERIMGRLKRAARQQPFDFVRRVDPEHLAAFLQHEHPQTIALVLAHIPAEKASVVVSKLDPHLQVEVARRLAQYDEAQPAVVEEVEALLQRKLSDLDGSGADRTEGLSLAADILNMADRATEKRILEGLEQEDPQVAAELRKRLIVFEDLVLLSDRDLRSVIQRVEAKDWTYALKDASDALKEKVFRNMSKRQTEALVEDMEFLGTVPLKDVEEAQQRIVAVMRRMHRQGEITVAKDGEETLVV